VRLWKAYHFERSTERRAKARWILLFLAAMGFVLAPAVGDARLGELDAGVHASQVAAALSNAARNHSASAPQAQANQPDPARRGTPPTIHAQMAELLQLANELQSDVEKTNKDTLSVSVVHKADKIEMLARAMKAERQGRSSGQH
jgi:small-conductance mechanosensitive channel